MAITSVEHEKDAAGLARSVIEAKLAACVQILPIRSVFIWNGEMNDTAEYLLLMKTPNACYEDLEKHIKDRHEYEIPEIVKVRIEEGYEPYLRWIQSATHLRS